MIAGCLPHDPPAPRTPDRGQFGGCRIIEWSMDMLYRNEADFFSGVPYQTVGSVRLLASTEELLRSPLGIVLLRLRTRDKIYTLNANLRRPKPAPDYDGWPTCRVDFVNAGQVLVEQE